MNIQTITNVNDSIPLYLPHGLYLKPHAKFNVSVSLPSNKLEKTISNLDIMDKLNNAIKPDKVVVLKVSKTTLEFIRFEGELEDRSKLRNVLARLDGLNLKISGFSEPFKVRACEAKDEFPSRHDWDSFFRDARNMDEMKPGERPDTIHLSNLPIRWFCSRHMENADTVKPSENIFRRIFEKFGSIRCVDIPICDPYRSQMKTEITGMKTFTFDQDVMFEGYVQFSEYLGFVKAMDEFRGMKLVRKMGDKNQAVNILVTFDKTKHLSDASIKRRNIVRERLIAKEKAKQEEDVKKRKQEEEKLERERKKQEEQKQKELEMQRQREERRKEKHLRKLREKGQIDLTSKIRAEERKLMIAQRKLESLRIVEALFDRIKQKGPTPKKHSKKKLKSNDLRNKLANKYKSAQEELLEKQKTKLEKVKGETGLRALIGVTKTRQDRSPSVNTISSDDSVLSDSHLTGKSRKKKQKKKETVESEPSISSSESESTKAKKQIKPLNPFNSLPNPEMAVEMFQQMTMYPYAAASILPVMAAAAGIRPGFFPPAAGTRPPFAYRAPRFPRRGGGRGMGGRRRDNPFAYDNEQYMRYFRKTSGLRNDEYDENGYHDEHDRRRSVSHSRSRSRSRSSSRTRSSHRYKSRTHRSHSRTRGRSRSRSRSHRSRSHSRRRSISRSRNKSSRRSRSKSQSKSKSKLVSTRRSRTESSSSGWSRSRSKSRSRSWSQSGRQSGDRATSNKIVLQPEKLVRSAKEIQRSVQQKLYERAKQEEEKLKRQKCDEPSTSKRSSSVDSSKFISPKRKAPSITPEKEWEKKT